MVPVEEELEARSMSLSITISCAVREGLEGEAWVLVEGVRAPILMSNIFL
jgi:hypothetical protein